MGEDLFAEAVTAEDFELPGDDQRLARIAAPEPVGPEPAAEAAEPVEAAPDAEATPETPEEPEAPALLAGKYKTPEDLERAYVELQQLHGRTSQEVGELRTAVQELAENVNRPVPAAPVEITSDLIDTNPAYAVQLAYEQNNGVAFQAALEQWKAEDPATAAVWMASKAVEEREAQLRADYDQRIQQLEQRVAPAEQATLQNQMGVELAKVANEFPEVDKIIEDGTLDQIAEQYPVIKAGFLSRDPGQAAAALRAAAEIARGRFGDTLKATQEQVARDTAAEAQRAREDAFVASSTTATSGAKPSRAEEIGAEWDAMEAPYKSGWNV